MKKIIISLAIIAAVAAVGIGVTVALFSDTETSAGNIFTAGSIDLKVDHTAQTYNGVDCKTCSVTLVSDTSNQVVSTTGGNDPVSFPHAAVLVTPTSITTQYWTASIPGASWIWATDPVTQNDSDNAVTYTFEKTFIWLGPSTGATLNLGIGADNNYSVILNGNSEGSNSGSFATADTISIPAAHIVQGINTLQIQVTNFAQPSQPLLNNPAGLLYKLVINGNCGDAYFQTHCSLWQSKDIGAGDTFFNFNDVKPGDFGTNEISLHVSSNDAYACFIVGNKDDQENSLLSPEINAGDTAILGNPTGLGELSDYINVFTWKDTNGNGVYNTGEAALGSGPLSTLTSIMNMDSSNSQFLASNTTQYIGLAWCAGTLTPNLDNPFSCNGASMGNIAQSDSFTADLTAYAEQVRNNSAFSCGSVQLPTQGGDTSPVGPDSVNLGAIVDEGTLTLGDFAIIAKDAITDANPSLSSVTGNIAINPTAGSAITGLSCTSVLGGGKIYSSGGYTGGYNSGVLCAVTDPVLALAARSAMETAYADAAGRTGPDGTELYSGNLGGRTFAPGLYKWSNNVTIPTDVTLSGGANDVWIFQISGDLSISSAMKVKLTGGAVAKNVFWQVGGPTGATLGTTSTFNGTILSAKQVIIQSGATLNGRVFAQSQVTMDGNIVTKP